MAMTYYAVTDDPNELAHWGVKGMKWGVRHDKPRHTGSSRPRSHAYKKAQSKLGKMMRNGIKKAKASWKEYNSPEKRYERQTNRALEQARKGKLKYGKLDDWQVRRITQRLDMERQARALSNTEPSVMRRFGRSIGEGIIKGTGEGFARKASEIISRGSVLKTDRKRMEQKEAFDKRAEERKFRSEEKKAENQAKREERKANRDLEREIKKSDAVNKNLVDKEIYKKKREREWAKEEAKLDAEEARIKKLTEEKKQKRLTASEQKEARRQERKEEQKFNREYKAYAKKVDKQNKQAAERQKRIEVQRQKDAETARIAEYRANVNQLANNVDRDREAAERARRKQEQANAWKARETRLYTSGKVRNPIANLYSSSPNTKAVDPDARRKNDMRNTSRRRKRKGKS